jgi:hypothetical protein
MSFLVCLSGTILHSVGCGHLFRFMWAAIPFDVGTRSGEVGICSGDAGQPETAPRVAA